MSSETGSFSPALTEALGKIKDANCQIVFFGLSSASIKFLRGDSNYWARFGSLETVIPKLEPRKDEQDFDDLAKACGPGENGVVNLASLVKQMKISGIIDKLDKDEITSLISFPRDNERDKNLRDCFISIIEREGDYGEFSLKDLNGRTLDIMAWLKRQPGGPEDLFEKYQDFVNSGRIEPGKDIKLERNNLTIALENQEKLLSKTVKVIESKGRLLITPGQNHPDDQSLAKLDKWEKTTVADAANGERRVEIIVDHSGPFNNRIILSSSVFTPEWFMDLPLETIKEMIGKDNKIFRDNHAGRPSIRVAEETVFAIEDIGDIRVHSIIVEDGIQEDIDFKQSQRDRFAIICQIATAMANLALGLPVPEAEQPKGTILPQWLREARDEVRSRHMEEKPTKSKIPDLPSW